jgi:phosphogluconate dehydratase
VLAAIHVSPEAACDGALARVRDGDRVIVCADSGRLDVDIDDATWAARTPMQLDLAANRHGVGRELFGLMRANVTSAEEGACALFVDG